jgi:hypothetical protein
MGEDKQEIEETPHGYNIKTRNSSFVTIDMVWRMVSTGDSLLASRPWLKDLCLSFSLFKLLRRRFGNTQLAEAGSAKAFTFVSDVLLNNGSPARVTADEISFVLDSYYSSLPTSYFGRLVPVLDITISVSILTWCLNGAISVSYSSSSEGAGVIRWARCRCCYTSATAGCAVWTAPTLGLLL